MATTTTSELASSSSSFAILLCLLLLSFAYGEVSMFVEAHYNYISTQQLSSSTKAPITKPTITWTTWCMAKPSADENKLKKNIEYVCSKVDCWLIRAGGPCFQPNTIAHRASFAMNMFYRLNGAHYSDCDFNKTALVALYNPSYGFGYCHFVESQSKPPKRTIKREDTWCVAKPGAPEKILEANINYVCGEFGDRYCKEIQENGSCFFPKTLTSHASVVMNRYYKTHGNYSCNFNDTGVIVMTNPNYGDCIYI